MLKRGLSGYVPVKNGDTLDYCWFEAVMSLLPVCDEVIISDGGSTDGTLEAAMRLSKSSPRIRVVNYSWPVLPTYETVKDSKPGPPGNPRMLIDWLNWTRQFCQYDMQITTDADEILDPASWPEIRRAVEAKECRWFRRLHFWKDANHITQDDKVCGTNVARLGPTEMEMVSDEQRHEGEPPIRQLATFHDSLRFFHYGFIRRPGAFFAKSKIMQAALLNSYDGRLKMAEESGINWTDLTEIGELVPFQGQHPDLMKKWLIERGYTP